MSYIAKLALILSPRHFVGQLSGGGANFVQAQNRRLGPDMLDNKLVWQALLDQIVTFRNKREG